MQISVGLPDDQFLGGTIVARGVKVQPAPAGLVTRINTLVGRRKHEEFPPPAVKTGIRKMLKRGGFGPSGRNKPASEYLAQAAREGRFPSINNLVDINNLMSLAWGLPMSMLDLDIVGESAEIRYGRAGEKYAFNATGQEIELEGLVCLCRATEAGGLPLGNPVKDSMTAKLKEKTTNVVAVVYGSRQAIDETAMNKLLEEFEKLLREHGGAREVERRLVP